MKLICRDHWAISVLVACLFLVTMRPCSAQTSHTWKSTIDQTQFDAELLDLAQGAVLLKKSDGTTLSIQYKTLAPEDATFVDQSIAQATKALVPLQTIAQPQLRTWHSAHSASQLQAEPLGVIDGKLHLKKTDGKLAIVDPKQLSLADLRYLKSLISPQASPDATSTADKPQSWTNPLSQAAVQKPIIEVRSNRLIFPRTPSQYFGAISSQGKSNQFQLVNILNGQLGKAFYVENSDTLNDAALSADGLLLADEVNNTLKVYSTQTGKRLCEISKFSDDYFFFLTSDRLVVYSKDGRSKSKIYDPNTGEPLAEIPSFLADIKIFAISPDGSEIALITAKKELATFDSITGLQKHIKTLERAGDFDFRVRSICYCRDGAQLALIGETRIDEMRLYAAAGLDDLAHCQLDPARHILTRPRDWPNVETFHEHKGWLVDGTTFIDSDTLTTIWSTQELRNKTGQTLGLLNDHQQLWLHRQTRQLSLETLDLPWPQIQQQQESIQRESQTGSVSPETSNLEQRHALAALKTPKFDIDASNVTGLYFPDLPSPWVGVLDAHNAKSFVSHNMVTGKRQLLNIQSSLGTLSLSPDGKTLASYQSGLVDLYSIAANKKTHTLPDISVLHMQFIAPDLLLTLPPGTTSDVCVFNTRTGKQMVKIASSGKSIGAYCVSPDCKTLAVATQDDLLRFYDLQTGQESAQWNQSSAAGLPKGISQMALCRDGTQLVILRSFDGVAIHDVATGKQIARVTPDTQLLQYSNSYIAGSCPIAESFSKPNKWLFFGNTIYDADQNVIQWQENPQKSDSSDRRIFTRLLDDDRQLIVTQTQGRYVAHVQEFPWPQLDATQQATQLAAADKATRTQEMKPVDVSAIKDVEFYSAVPLYAGKPITPHPKLKPAVIALSGNARPFDRQFFSSSAAHKFLSAPASQSKTALLKSIFPTYDDKVDAAPLLVDLISGQNKLIAGAQFIESITDVSPPGNFFCAWNSETPGRIDIFSLNDGKLALAFIPAYKEVKRPDHLPPRFIAENILMTSNGTESIAWDIPTGNALYRMDGPGPAFAFNHQDRFLKLAPNNTWYVHQASDGSRLGKISPSVNDARYPPTQVDIRDDDAAAVGLDATKKRITIWDLQTGQQTHELWSRDILSREGRSPETYRDHLRGFKLNTPKLMGDSPSKIESVTWCTSDILLVAWYQTEVSQTQPAYIYSLVSIADGRTLWQYRLPQYANLANGRQGQLWFLDHAQAPPQLVGVDIPTPLAKQKLAAATAPTLLLEKNSAVAFASKVDLPAPQDQQAIASTLKAMAARILLRHDIQIAADADNRLDIFVTQRGDLLVSTVILSNADKKILWQQSTQSRINARNTRERYQEVLSQIQHFLNPAKMYTNDFYNGLGQSQLTAQGEQIISMYRP